MNRLPIIFLSLLCLAETLCAQTAVQPQGSGSSDSPYQIDSLPNLYWLSKNSSAWTANTFFVQNKDIDASPTRAWGGTVFTAIGNSMTHFSGTYHGKGHKISGLYIKVTGGMQGLFGVLSGTVDSLGLEKDSVIATSAYAGGLVGYLVGGTVVSSYSKDGYVKGQNNVGGLIGNLYSGSVTSSYTTGQVVGAGNVGGLAGLQEGTTCRIQSSYSLSAVSGSSNVGGFIGFARYGSFTTSYSAGSVTGTSNVGGFAGNLEYATITTSYSTGSVTGTSDVGGFAGNLETGATITKSYYNSTTSGLDSSAGGSALSESGMRQQSSFVDWDFASTWILYSDKTYPLLRSFMKPLTVTVRDTSETYKAVQAVLPGYAYFPESYDASKLQGALSLSGTGANATNVGTYTVTPTGIWSNQDGYQVQFVSGTLAITPIALTVTANAASKVYGLQDPVFTYNTSGLIGSDVLTGSLTRTAGENVDSYDIAQGTLANANYTIAYTPAKFAITPAALTVTADATSKVYGENDPVLTYKTFGLTGSDILTGSLTRTAGENVDSYDIAQGTLANANYTIAYTPAKFAITPAALTVTADATSKVYGENDPVFTYKTSGLIGSDVLTGSLERAAGENVDSYAIGKGTLANANYAIAYTPAVFSITQAALTVTADDVSKVYGESDPKLTYKASGLIGSDVLTGSLERAAGENVDSYAIGKGTLANTNYTIAYTPAKFAITPAALTVTADAASKVYGENDPVFTYKTSGLIGSDVLTGSLTRTTGENVDSYTITLGSVSNPNYAITYKPSILLITPKTVSIVANADTITLGDALPVFTYQVSGLIGDDTLTGYLECKTDAIASMYPITQGTLSAGNNYRIDYTGANVVVNAPVSTIGTARSLTHPTPRIVYAQGQIHTKGIAGTIRIYTLQGKMIALFRQGSSSYPLYLPPGTYVVQGADLATKITVGWQ